MHMASQPSGCGAVGDKKRKAEGGGRSTINQLPRLPDQRLEKLRQSTRTRHGTTPAGWGPWVPCLGLCWDPDAGTVTLAS